MSQLSEAAKENKLVSFYSDFYFNPHPRICLFILERGRNTCWLPPIRALIRNQTHNLDTCPDQESDPQLFGVRTDAPTN